MHRNDNRISSTSGADRVIRVSAISSALVLVLAACGGGDSGNEAVIEQLIENETGEDVEFDLDGDGGFSLETEDGNFSINVDEEGNVEFDSDEGSGVFDSDGDGGGSLTFEDEDGETGNVEFETDDDGNFTVTGEDGETVVGDIDEDEGSFTVTGDDGESTFQSGPGIPEQWPADIPQPIGMTDVTGTFIGDANTLSIVAAGTPPGDPLAYLEDYVSQLVAAGFSETATFTSEGNVSYSHERGDLMVNSSFTDLGSAGQIVVAINQF